MRLGSFELLRARYNLTEDQLHNILGNLKLKGIPSKETHPIFGKVGIEPTFYTDISRENGMSWDTLITMQRTFSESANHSGAYQYTKRLTKIVKRAYEDDGVVEIPTVAYTNPDRMFSDMEYLLKQLKKYHNLIPSSSWSREAEGGCHMTFHISNLSIGEQHERGILLSKRLKNFMYNNPYIAWAFLSPYDNISSCCNTLKKSVNDTAKGDAIFLRSTSNGVEVPRNVNVRLELRFFEMFRTVDELKMYYNFATTLLKFIKETEDIVPTERFYRRSLTECIEDLKSVCSRIRFDYDTLVSFGKVQNLKDRYKKGKSFLN